MEPCSKIRPRETYIFLWRGVEEEGGEGMPIFHAKFIAQADNQATKLFAHTWVVYQGWIIIKKGT